MDLLRGTLDHCVKCTICETACPFSRATPLFPGPKYVGPQAERFRVEGLSPDASVDYCSGCGICTQVCPQDVKIAEINSQARARLWQERGIPFRNQVLARPSVMGRVGSRVATLANLTLASRTVRRLLEPTLGVHRDAPLPSFAGGTFQRWARRHPEAIASRTVAYFHGCGTNYYEPGVGRMVVAVLEHNGFRVPIVTNSTSCGLMLKREAREILEVGDEELRVVGELTYDICEFLLDLHDRGELQTDFQPLELTVPYHAPCQQRGHGIGKPALDLLALVPGLNVVELDTDCCGIAGTYGLKREKYEIAMQVGEDLFRQVKEANPDVTACDSETCRWQIAHATGVAAVHPVELLHRSYRLAQ